MFQLLFRFLRSPWNFPPAVCLLFFLGINFGVVMLLRRLEGNSDWPLYWVVNVGDAICLPFFAFFTSQIIKRRIHSGPQTNLLVSIALLAFGFALFSGLELYHIYVDKGPEYDEVSRQLSQIWHNFIIAPIMCHQMLTGVIAGIYYFKKEPTWLIVPAIIFGVGYLATGYIDNVYLDPGEININNY